MADTMVKYTASDGCEVKLTPGIVLKHIVSGSGNPTDKEVFAFMAKCQARGLNPLAGDAYMTCYNNRDGSVSSSVITSKDYFVRTATSQPDFDGMRAGVVVIDRNGQMEYREGSLVGGQTERLIGGWAEVYSKNRKFPSKAVVSLSEYDQGRSLWKTKPATMIRKVALVQAIREAYPQKFGGIYDADEMPEHHEPNMQCEEPEIMEEDATCCVEDTAVAPEAWEVIADGYEEEF